MAYRHSRGLIWVRPCPRSQTSIGPAPDRALHRNADCDADTRVPLVVHVVPIVDVDNINFVGFVPIVGPVPWPRINQTEPKAVVLEAREPANHHIGLAVDDERVVLAEVAIVTVVRDAVAVVAAALLPRAVVRLPVL